MKRNNKPAKKLALKKTTLIQLQSKEMNKLIGGDDNANTQGKTSVDTPMSCVLACR
jgi:natural product precursor